MYRGIYALYWLDIGQVYVGQSDNIVKRLNTHKSKLRLYEHPNIKMQELYNKYGMPDTYILEECSDSEIQLKEKSWIIEFNSINEGLNQVMGGCRNGSGIFNSNAKHSKRKILRIFSLLYRTTNSQLKISQLVNVPKSTIGKIATGDTHSWLRETYPDKWVLLQSNNKLRTANQQKYFNTKHH